MLQQIDTRIATFMSVLLVTVSLTWILGIPVKLGFTIFDEQVLAFALGCALAISAALFATERAKLSSYLSVMAGLVLIVVMAFVAVVYPKLMVVAMMRPTWLFVISVLVLCGLLFYLWRNAGLPITIIVFVFGLVAIYGSSFGIPTTKPDRLSIYLLVDANGLLGLPLRVAVEIVISFVLLGELLRQSGGSEYLTKLSLAAFGRFRGGTAKASCAASAAFGSISGNAVSNVVGTGIVTIPLMKRSGLSSTKASATEAAASTGGQLLPPVMGAAAFVMADYLRVPYSEVAIAALLPAILYFFSIFMQIDRDAAREGIAGLDTNETGQFRPVMWAGAHLLLPFAVLIYVLFLNQTRPGIAALAAAVCLVIVSFLRPYEGRRLTLQSSFHAVIETGKTVAPLMLVTAAAGAFIGLVSLTGLGFSIASDVVEIGGGNPLLVLVLIAVISIVFGMGMPTVAVYVVLSTVLAPALVSAGISELQGHLFILYFGMLSMLTPPVALASIAAARIGGADMWRTSFSAVRLAWIAYIVPFLFAFSPEMLLGGTLIGAAAAAISALLAISAVAVASAGFDIAPVGLPLRFAYLAAGVGLILPPTLGTWSVAANICGAALIIGLFLRARNLTKKSEFSSSIQTRSKL
jgi:TRAP transporter 4TM/12TM fusion protein